jgi:hypothetical protein
MKYLVRFEDVLQLLINMYLYGVCSLILFLQLINIGVQSKEVTGVTPAYFMFKRNSSAFIVSESFGNFYFLPPMSWSEGDIRYKELD